MNVAIYVRNKETCSLLSRLLNIYQEKDNCLFSTRFFETDIDLIYSLSGGEYDVIFFGDVNHEQLIQEVREKDRRVRLICIADLENIPQENDEIWYCLPEPLSRAFLFPVLDRLRIDTNQRDEGGLVIKSRGTVAQLPFSLIEYVEVMGKSVSFHLADGTTEEVSSSFSTFEGTLLHWPDFIKVHRAYIVNLRYVQKLESGSLLTRSGHSVPVSRHLYPQLKKDYLCRLMEPEVKEIPPVTPTKCATASNGNGYSVLLVDDEAEQRLHWSEVLIQHGCTVETAHNGETALALSALGRFDCVILDVKLGAERGFDLCADIGNNAGAPVIFLSSLDDSDHQIQGFLSGGIDYISKGASDALFWLKVETRIKITKAGKSDLNNGDLHLNLKLRKTFWKNQEIRLTTVEFDLLCFLMAHPETVYAPTHLYEEIWGAKQQRDSPSVQLHLSQLRRKLDTACQIHSFIETVWGEGYRFVPLTPLKEESQ